MTADSIREPDWVMVGCRDLDGRFHVFGSTSMATADLIARTQHGGLASFALTADLRQVAHGAGWTYAEAIRDLFGHWNADEQQAPRTVGPGARALPEATDGMAYGNGPGA